MTGTPQGQQLRLDEPNIPNIQIIANKIHVVNKYNRWESLFSHMNEMLSQRMTIARL